MKKQIAVLMAAATAVTTVAPAIANAEVTSTKDVKFSEITTKMKAALVDSKYTDGEYDGISATANPSLADYQKSTKLVVLSSTEDLSAVEGLRDLKDGERVVAGEALVSAKAVKAGVNHHYVVEKVSGTLESKLEELSMDKEKVVVASIIDKGVESGNAVRKNLTKKHYVLDAVTSPDTQDLLGNAADTLLTNFKKTITYVKKLKVATKGDYELKELTKESDLVAADVVKVEFELESGAKYTLKAGDPVLDFKKAYDDKNNLLKASDINQQSVANKVKSFDTIDNANDLKATADIPTGNVEEYVLGEADLKRVDKEIVVDNAIDAKGKYTEAGAKVVNRIIKAKETPFVFNYDGVQYVLEKNAALDVKDPVNSDIEAKSAVDGALAANKAKIEAADSGFVLKFDLKAYNKNNEKKLYTLKFQFKSEKQAALKELVDALKGDKEVVAGDFTKIAGANRYATAVEVSKEKFAPGKAGSIVIVGGDAVIDGLSAAPLASAKNAPILVADKKNGLNDETKAEIKRALDTAKKTVYIVGGESSVPKSVDKQLTDMGLAVVRLQGGTRYDTSLEVYKQLKSDGVKDDKVFAIGGHGEADAMSISPVAADKSDKTFGAGDANKVTPILVVKKDGLGGKTARELDGVTKVDIIGGLGSVGNDTFIDLKKIPGVTEIARVSGANRYATNLEVIKKYYDVDGNASGIATAGIIVASGKDKNLVDPQTASVIADAKPIMLVDAKLKEDQVKLLKKNEAKFDDRVYQVGGVVTADVMKEVVKTLGL